MAETEATLRDASKSGDVATVNKLLADGVPQTPNENGDAPLHFATSCYLTQPEYVEVVRTLLDNGADVNLKNKDGNAAIHNTASNGHLEIMELLLENGGDFEAEGELHMVPLGLAATKKHHAVVNCLVKKLVDENKFSKKQAEWMNKAESDTQQMHIYRALTSIFAEKIALVGLVKFGVIESILKGMKQFTKTSIQTSALKLLAIAVNIPEGLAVATSINLKAELEAACKDRADDAVVSHLLNEVTKKL